MTALTTDTLPTAGRAPRYATARSTLFVDRLMSHFIRAGGVLIIIAVLGIFIFIFGQIVPLFLGAKVAPGRTVQLEPGRHVLLGIDEWAELPFVLDASGRMQVIDLAANQPTRTMSLPLDPPCELTAFAYNVDHGELIVGTADGHFGVILMQYSAQYIGNQRRVDLAMDAEPLKPIGPAGSKVVEIGYGDAGAQKLVVGLVEIDGRREVHAVALSQQTTLLGAGEVRVDADVDLTGQIRGSPEEVLVARDAQAVIVTNDAGEVFYFRRDGNEVALMQVFEPFGDLPDRRIASIDFLFGDLSLVMTNDSGVNRVFSLYMKGADAVKGAKDDAPDGKASGATLARRFGQTKEFEPLPGPGTCYARSLRTKAFLIGAGDFASLRFATTQSVRWEERLPFMPQLAAISGKDNCLAFLDDHDRLHLYQLSDPHPEASVSAFFGKLWYEGSSHPKYEWQSTGGSDDFEPKFSLVPLIIGTLKGTFYALLFAVPIALIAALYTSQFAHPRVRAVVKPTMEIMASLPSVVLGFLAALWLAPILETRVPSILLMLVGIPLSAMVLGTMWSKLSWGVRRHFRPGSELVILAAVALLVGWTCWHLGPVIERFLFVVPDPITGDPVADFRKWWPAVSERHWLLRACFGGDFQQRNSLVVGFMMGFAVIPIIFAISEDSLSNVPAALRSGSLALGASRWQTAIRIVVPTASAGIFSALMVGLGRAVGETMIVLMATGNTPIMDFNIFSGMRTLSANIAVELPEAPHAGTLYRSLFLGAMVLFLMTFAVNTVAEVLRQRLRTRYRIA